MGTVYDPWKAENIMSVSAALLEADWEVVLPTLSKLNESGFRLPAEQAGVFHKRYFQEHGDTINWRASEVILIASALARLPQVPDLVEQVFAMGDFELTGVASRALLAWHGLPELYLIFVGELDCAGFGQMPLAAQDYIRGVDLSGTWERCGISQYFEDADPEKLALMSGAFVRMDMPATAAALDEAAELWAKADAIHDLGLSEEAFSAAFYPARDLWEAAAWKMNDGKNRLLEGISRHAAKHASELREALDWTQRFIIRR